MEKVAIDAVDNERNPMKVHSVRKPVSRELGTDRFAMNYFELEAGESFSVGLHRHGDQEEVFYVESVTATFEVGVEREAVVVDAGELIRFPPGEFQKGYNDGEATVEGWALGAPGARTTGTNSSRGPTAPSATGRRPTTSTSRAETSS